MSEPSRMENSFATMRRVYKSRVGLEVLLPVLFIMLGIGALMAWERIWVGLAMIVFTTAFVLYVLLGFRYIIADGTLEIRCGALYQKRISIASIRSLRETRNPLSAPAASLDRLEIRFGKWDSVMVSPREKRAFVEALRTVNPGIEVVEKR